MSNTLAFKRELLAEWFEGICTACVCVRETARERLTFCAIWLTQGEVQFERSGPLELQPTGDNIH